jgi:hypothetical protein
MMLVTSSGTPKISRTLDRSLGQYCPSIKNALRIDCCAKQLFQCLDVFGEGLAASFGDAVQGLRLAQHELLFD